MIVWKFKLLIILTVCLLPISHAVALEDLKCPSLERAADEVKFEISHYSDDDWELEGEDGSFYVSVDYKLCIFQMFANMSAALKDRHVIENDWDRIHKLGNWIELDGDMYFKHTAILPNSSNETLAWNLVIFDTIAGRAFTHAKSLQEQKNVKLGLSM